MAFEAENQLGISNLVRKVNKDSIKLVFRAFRSREIEALLIHQSC